MPATLRGIYHNLRESKYIVTNDEIFFFFSSQKYMEKYLNGYKEFRRDYVNKIKMYKMIHLNMETLADIVFYVQTEKRGFHAQLKGANISWQEIQKYALRKMIEKNTKDWQETQRTKLGERLKSMG